MDEDSGKPAKKKKPPRTPVSLAMLAHAQESRAYIGDVIASVPYAEFQHRVALQRFELTLFLAASDLWEDVSVTDEKRAEIAGGLGELIDVRISPLYLELKDRLQAEALSVRDEAADDQAWVERQAGHAKRALARGLRHGKSSEQERIAQSIIDRQIPKKRREQESDETPLRFHPETLAMIEAAALVAGRALQLAATPRHLLEDAMPPAPAVKNVTPEKATP